MDIDSNSSAPAAAGAQNVLVLGGTGFVGSSVCRRLSARLRPGARVTVATRTLDTAAHLRALPGLEVLKLDVFDAVPLARAVERHDVVVNLIAVLHGDAARFQRMHVDLVETLVGVCKAAAKPRVVHVSALGAGAGAPSLYLRSKTEGEARLRTAGIDASILRPSVIFGADDRFLNMFASLCKLAPFVPLARAHARFQPVWVEDVAEAIVRCVESAEGGGQVFECAGPKVYELIDLVRLAGVWSGHRRLVFPLPDVLGDLQAAILERLPGEPLMSRDNLASMLRPNVASGKPGLAELGVKASALEAVAPLYLRKP